jgi:enoyl-CoA hydratase/carnithine racemase
MIRIDDADGVRLISIDRVARRNALDHEHYTGIAAALERSAADDDTRVVVITGTGDVFCAGQDLDEMAALARGEPVGDGSGPAFPRLLAALESCPKPLLAAVNGAGAGIGMTMLLHCDIVVVAERARLRAPFAELGVPPEAGSSALLADVVGWQAAAELLFTSRWIDSSEAVELGLARRRVADHDVVPATLELARSVAAHSPWAVQTAKRLMLAARGDRSRDARAREDSAFAELFGRGRST